MDTAEEALEGEVEEKLLEAGQETFLETRCEEAFLLE